MEVGKLIMNVKFKKATMTLSVKPFGCMPSSGVSDGVQSLVTERHPEAIYCAIETNGDGAVNVYSRVQMMLFKARLAAKEEYQKTLEAANLDVDGLKRKLQKSWWKRSALYYPKHGSVAAMASNVVEEVTGAAAAH
jgi:predicted nucleotide-binding protein (sugar kinase/HSP70/actin superfamily)